MRLGLSVTGLLLGATLIASPASAAPMAGVSANLLPQVQLSDDATVVPVQYRRGSGRGGPRRGGRGGGGNGGAVAAGILGGLFLGAIIAGEAQRQNSVNYCAQRFRSYDPGSGTYLGTDGRRHSCP